ncbi:MAG: hypothetical protein U1A78_41575 [Polyangia bacterium]
MQTDRAPLDRYDSPPYATEALVRSVPELRGHTLLDPCCGDSSMAWRLRTRFRRVLLNDIDPQIPTLLHWDLRRPALWESARADWCVTNPPFCLAGETLNLALDHCRVGVALLLRLSALEVCEGREFIELYPPQRTIVLPRIRFRGKGTDKATVAWFIWSRLTLSGPPIVCISRRTARRLAFVSTPSGVLLPIGQAIGGALA